MMQCLNGYILKRSRYVFISNLMERDGVEMASFTVKKLFILLLLVGLVNILL